MNFLSGANMRSTVAILGFFLAVSASGGDGSVLSVSDAADRAMQQSQLTLPGSKPFHLQAVIRDTSDPNSDYQAKIDEYWVSPTKWKRTIESEEFSQTLIVNGDAVSEQDKGDYSPFWLKNFVTSLTDPLPMLSALKQSNAQIQKPQGSERSTSCADLHSRVDRWVICFEGSHGLLASVFSKGYAMEFKDFKKFGDKRVPTRLTTDPEPGTKLEARILELTEFTQPDDQMFVVSQPTPPKDRIKSIRIDEEALRKLALGSTEIDWPPVGEGLTTGGCAVYVSADRAGNIREAWPEGCDSASLQDPLREAVKKWRLKPAISDGVPVQVEALLGFTFHTTVDKSLALPELSDEEVRKLSSNAVEPVFPPGSVQKGTEVVIQISVDESGKLTGVGNTHNLDTKVFGAAYVALRKWHFSPYIKHGKPQYFHANVSFHVQ
jgi:hypothetical protein